jgi:hypothetical protein
MIASGAGGGLVLGQFHLRFLKMRDDSVAG